MKMKKYLFWVYLIAFSFFMNAQGLSAKNWEYQKSGTASNLTAVSFVDNDHGWAVGENATILATSDGGVNWKILSPELIDKVPAAVSSYLRMYHFQSVCFLDRENGWVAGEMTLLGVDPKDTYPFPVQFGVILYTRDGGQSWECQYTCNMWTALEPEALPGIKQINDVFFLNRQEGWAVGDGFYYLATKDGGNTWEEKPIGLWVIPEIRQNLAATRWISPQLGWVSGYQYDMFYPERRNGFIAHTEDGGKTWEIDDILPLSSATVRPLTDLEVKCPQANTLCPLPQAKAVGEQGTILHLVSEGWEHQGFSWPFSLPLPQFNAVGFVDDSHGWIIGYRLSNYPYEDSNPAISAFMTIFHTDNAGQNWKHFPWNDPGRLNDIDLAGGTDAWAVGDEGVILHYQNHAPEICRAWAEPQTLYAGQAVDLYVSVKDLDGPSDIEKVTVDTRSIGGGMVVLERTWLDSDDRRCVLFQGKAVVSPLAAYGSHRLPVEAVDYDGARASEEIDLFVITSWVEIKRTWAIPNPVAVGNKVLLAAQVDIVAPKGPDCEENNLFHNKVEKVTVDITELLGVDCQPGSDCIIIVEMTDPDGDGIYTYMTASVTGGPGNYKLPVRAVDTLGHQDKAELCVKIVSASICEGDFDVDGDVDGSDLATFAADFGRTDCETGEPCEGDFDDDGDVDGSDLAVFAADFGRTDCPRP